MAEVRPDQQLAARPATAATTPSPIPQWADKPYGFANFLRAARFVNSLYNGELLIEEPGSARRLRARHLQGAALDARPGAACTTSPATSAPARPGAAKRGFVVPSQDEWIKSAYYDPTGGGTYSYWKYPTNAGVFGDDTATRPAPTTLDPATGDVTNAATQPVATYHASGAAGADLVPGRGPAAERLLERQPVRHRPDDLRRGLPGQPRHGRPGEDPLAVGHARPGRQRGRVDRHDHPAPRRAERGRGSGGGCTAAFPTPPPTSCGSRRSVSSPRTTRSSRSPIRGSASASA